MAPRKESKKQEQAADTLATENGSVTPPKKRKTVAKSADTAAPKEAKTVVPRQIKKIKEQAVATAFSPMKLRSGTKKIAPIEQTVEQKTHGDGKSATAKKTRDDSKTATSKKKTKTAKPMKPEAKAIVKKLKEIENGVEEPSKKTNRRRKVNEGVAKDSASTAKGQTKKQRTPRNAEIKDIAEINDEEKKNDEEMTVPKKKARGKTKKTAMEIVRLNDLTKTKNRIVNNEIIEVMNLPLESPDENNAKDVPTNENNISPKKNNESIEIKDELKTPINYQERSPTFLRCN